MNDDMRTVPLAMDQEEVAHLFRQYGLVSAPVVEDAGRLVGVVTVADVVHIIDEEAEEDLLKLAGVQETYLYRAVLAPRSDDRCVGKECVSPVRSRGWKDN